MARPVRYAFFFPLAAAALLSDASDARADVSSWFAVGGGGATERSLPSATRNIAIAMTSTVGVGTSPTAPLVVGGIARGTLFFGLGFDIGLAVRLATGGFARGDWGLALDAGALWRSWGEGSYGDWPVQGVLTLGCPWGFELAAGAELWSVDGGTSAQGFFAALEIDLLRLTVMRQGSTEPWWPNPNPAGGHKATASAGW
jgi:hypothetical protein